MSISVIVPVFNESENIDGFLERIIKVLEKTTNEYGPKCHGKTQRRSCR